MRCSSVRPALVLLLLLASGATVAAESATLFVARRGWHIDVGLAVAELAAPLQSVASRLADTRYVFFGFADKHYLLASRHNAPVLLSALWPGAAIILLTEIRNSPQQAFGDEQVIALHIDVKQMRALQNFIWKSLRTHDGSIDVYRQGPYEDSAYFLAVPKYSAFHTCNTWGAEALKATGFRVHTTGVIFAGQLWVQARRLKRAQDKAASASAASAAGASIGRWIRAAAAAAAAQHSRRDQISFRHSHISGGDYAE